MEIKIIAEASTRLQRLFVGWGVSFLVDNDLLFDTFSNARRLKKNLELMNIKINDLKYVVISHDHWDHTNGLWYVLQENPDMKVFVCPGFSKEFKEKLNKFNATIVECQDITRIKENIFTTGEIAGEYDRKPIVEQSLVIKNNKLSIVTGCAHPGIVTIIKRIKQNFSCPINLVLGGFHLCDKSILQIHQIAGELKNLQTEKIAPCHCTGRTAVQILQKEYKENLIEANTGSVIKL
ncbi:MAG: MBL fold metallo-hydrolase [Elusimicrobiota bacterium]